MGAVTSFSGAVAVRFFLGVFESAVTPGFALFTSQWYTKKEQGQRVGIWFSFNGFGQIFGGLIAYGIAVGARRHGSSIAPWKIVFLVCGLLTAFMGLLFLIFVPDNQLNARWLSKSDRRLAIERVRSNQQGIGNKHFKRYQLIEALTDPLTWAFVFYALTADIPNGGISNFFSELIVSFGYTPEQSLLYGTPGGGVEVIALIVCGVLGDRLNNRLLVSTTGLILAILGMLLIVGLPLHNHVGRLIGYYLTQASPTPFVALLSLIATNVAGYTKKTTVAALYLIAYCAGNIIGPQTFRPKDAPRYVPAEITIVVCWGLCLVDILFIWWYCRRMNRKKAGVRAQEGYVKCKNQEFMDLTDRYVYSLPFTMPSNGHSLWLTNPPLLSGRIPSSYMLYKCHFITYIYRYLWRSSAATFTYSVFVCMYVNNETFNVFSCDSAQISNPDIKTNMNAMLARSRSSSLSLSLSFYLSYLHFSSASLFSLSSII